MTQTHFHVILIGMAFTGAAGLWAAAWTLCGPVGRRRLAFGLRLDELARDMQSWTSHSGRHETIKTREVPLYDGEAVRHLGRRTEAERQAEYAALRAEAVEAAVSVSAAPLVDFTAELKLLTQSDSQPAVPADLAALHEVVRLHEELAAVEASYAQRIRLAIARATAPNDLTQEYALVNA
jgi:hypothetical protein